jgi:topoisomerase IV subunit A
VLVPGKGALARICTPVDGDVVALLGDNRKLLICRIEEIPEMSRGRGVMLQRYKDGGLADAKIFRLANGLSWRQGENRVRTETALDNWFGARAQAGRMVPPGFAKKGFG